MELRVSDSTMLLLFLLFALLHDVCAADVVYLDAKTDTYLEEVSSCNIFVRKGKTIKTPPLSGTILPGEERLQQMSCKPHVYIAHDTLRVYAVIVQSLLLLFIVGRLVCVLLLLPCCCCAGVTRASIIEFALCLPAALVCDVSHVGCCCCCRVQV
jgi:hypothetical protein